MFSNPIYTYYPSEQYMNYYYYQMLMSYYQPATTYACFVPQQSYSVERTSIEKIQNRPQEQPKTDQVVPRRKISSQLQRARARALAKKALKELITSKKNGQSNIVNRFFTLFQNKQRSKAMVTRIVSTIKANKQNQENIINDFYKIIIQMSNSQKRAYVSRKNIFDLSRPQNLEKKILKMKEVGYQIISSKEHLSELFRKCIQKFMNSWSLMSIINSKRISSIGKKQYLRRKREIQQSFKVFLDPSVDVSDNQ